MKALILEEPNKFSVQEIEKPEIGDGDILLRMEKAAICGTDIRILEGRKTKDVRYPSVIGHEFSGVIVEQGKNVKGYELNQKVAVANVIPCGLCYSCLTGRENACMNRQAIGYEFDGGFQEYIRIPEIAIENGNVIILPDKVSFTSGALIEPLACCIRGLKNVGTKLNDVVVIVGAGPIGLMHLQLSKIVGASKVIVSEPNEYRRQKALSLGADLAVNPLEEDLKEIVFSETGGIGADVVILAIGVEAIVNDVINLARKGGAVSLFAGFTGEGMAMVSANAIHYNELKVTGSTAYTRMDYRDSASLVSSGRINLDEIATHVYKLEDFLEAYKKNKEGTGLKIMLEP